MLTRETITEKYGAEAVNMMYSLTRSQLMFMSEALTAVLNGATDIDRIAERYSTDDCKAVVVCHWTMFCKK